MMFAFIIGTLIAVGVAFGTNYIWHVAPVEAAKKAKLAAEKARLVDPEFHVIGLQTGTARLVTKPSSFVQVAPNGKFDTTSYPDRAVFKLYNNSGGDLTCTGISIQGKAVVQHDAAYQWIYKDYSSIERDGETSVEVSNAFIMDADQVESLGDYVKKELSAHSMYQIHLPGCAFNYDINDTWHLTLAYTINGQASEAESIDVDVEITRVSFSRQVGGIGETLLVCRVPSGTWSKTTSRRARLISTGRAQDLNNRGNTLTVAASDYTGQADYYCDGTDDDIQIQDAIDVTASTGGTVLLTHGSFILGDSITMKNNTILIGQGPQTILIPASTSVTNMISFSGSAGARIADFTIDGLKASLNFTTANMKIIDGAASTSCDAMNIVLQNYKLTADSSKTFYAFYDIVTVVGCTITATETVVNSTFTGINNLFGLCDMVVGCKVFLNTLDCSGTQGRLIAFSNCKNLSSCSAYSNSTTGSNGSFYGYDTCSSVGNCDAFSNSTSGGSANVYGFNACTYLSGCRFYSNSTAGATAFTAGFTSCVNISVCNSASNSTPGAGSIDYGFSSCSQVQQCKSSDATPYNASYADAATNACANTYTGGYNS